MSFLFPVIITAERKQRALAADYRLAKAREVAQHFGKRRRPVADLFRVYGGVDRLAGGLTDGLLEVVSHEYDAKFWFDFGQVVVLEAGLALGR